MKQNLQYKEHDDVFFNKGDKCFLFLTFNIDLALYEKLPIQIFPGVSLTKTPRHALTHSADNNAKECENITQLSFIIPGYPSTRPTAICIKIDKDIPDEQKNRLFLLTIGALTIVKPLFIVYSGAFFYEDQENRFVDKPERLELRSNISLNAIAQAYSFDQNFLCYKTCDIESAKNILPKLINIFQLCESNPRPFYNLNTFLQLEFWERLNYESTLFLKLFPFLDSFSGNPPGQHAKNISSRIATFLSNIPHYKDQKHFEKETIEKRLKTIWELHRYPELHGHLKLPESVFASNINTTRDLFDLFEIARLCLYKMLLLPDNDFENYSKISIPKIGLSISAAKELNQERDKEACLFFDKTYNNPPELVCFIDITQQ